MHLLLMCQRGKRYFGHKSPRISTFDPPGPASMNSVVHQRTLDRITPGVFCGQNERPKNYDSKMCDFGCVFMELLDWWALISVMPEFASQNK